MQDCAGYKVFFFQNLNIELKGQSKAIRRKSRGIKAQKSGAVLALLRLVAA
jgi:hypothetical protein